MMKKIKIVYIDDNIDISLSKFLAEKYSRDGFEIESAEVNFDTTQSYPSLLCNDDVRTANIVIVDSKLFEDQTVSGNKFTGEEFKILLKKFYPYIEVFVITQNDLDPNLGVNISKWRKSKTCNDGLMFYQENITAILDNAIDNIIITRNLADKIKENIEIDAVTVEKIINSLEGNDSFDELKKSDIDELIKTFEELRKGDK